METWYIFRKYSIYYFIRNFFSLKASLSLIVLNWVITVYAHPLKISIPELQTSQHIIFNREILNCTCSIIIISTFFFINLKRFFTSTTILSQFFSFLIFLNFSSILHLNASKSFWVAFVSKLILEIWNGITSMWT